MKQICFEQKRKEKNDVLFHQGQVLYLFPYRFFLSSNLMPPQPFSTLYIISCSLSLHPPQDSQNKDKKKKKVTLRSGWLPVCERCKCFSILLNYWNKPKIDVKRWKGMWLKKIMCFYVCVALKIVRPTEGGGRRVLSTETSLRLTFISASYGCSASIAVLIWDLRVEDEIRMRRWRRGEGQSSW